MSKQAGNTTQKGRWKNQSTLERNRKLKFFEIQDTGEFFVRVKKYPLVDLMPKPQFTSANA